MSQPGTTPALHAVAPVVATQLVALQPFAYHQYGTASMQPTSQAGAPVVNDAHLAPQVGAPLAMGAQAAHEGVHVAMCTQAAFVGVVPIATCVPSAAQVSNEGVHAAVCTQPVHFGGAPFAVNTSPPLQVGAPLAMGAQPALPVGAQSAELAADWDEKDANTLLKFSSRPRFYESAGNKIKGFVVDLELYLRMCGRPVHR